MTSPTPHDSNDQALRIAIAECQNLWQRWQDAINEEARARLQAGYTASLERLWSLLADDLYAISRYWRRSKLGPDVESIALSHFAEIIIALPRLTIDPTKNARHLLLTIFRRGLISEHRILNDKSTSNLPKAKLEPPVDPDTPASQAWDPPAVEASKQEFIANEEELPDPHSLDEEDRIFSTLYNRAMISTIHTFWNANFPREDRRILEGRWQCDPPRSYQEITAALGPGWTEANVRKRHQRALERTRKFLEDQNLHREA